MIDAPPPPNKPLGILAAAGGKMVASTGKS